MEKHELIAKISEVLSDEFEVDMSALTPEANIKKTLQLDSLNLVDMVALIEDNFGVRIKGADAGNIHTFGALYDFVYLRHS